MSRLLEITPTRNDSKNYFDTPSMRWIEQLSRLSEYDYYNVQSPIELNDTTTLTPFPINHRSIENLEVLRPQLDQAIAASDGVIVEYMPPEIRQIDECVQNCNWVIGRMAAAAQESLTNYKQILPYFDRVLEQVATQGKDVYCLDPAHGMSFAYIRGGILAAAVTPPSAAIAIHDIKNNGMSRRTFLAVGTTFAITSLAFGQFDDGERNRTPFDRIHPENTFRETIVAKGVQNMAERNENTGIMRNFALIYPEGHMETITRYLVSRSLDFRFQVCSQLKEVQDWKDQFFSARQYRFLNNSWQLIDRSEIV